MSLGQPDEDAIRTATEAFHPFARVLEDQLDQKTFILGTRSRLPIIQWAVIRRWFYILNPEFR
jgi:hypothetical protein